MEKLLQVKKQVEQKFESEKWAMIAAGIQDMGGDKYPAATCQKKFKDLTKSPAKTKTNNMQAASENADDKMEIDKDEDAQDADTEV